MLPSRNSIIGVGYILKSTVKIFSKVLSVASLRHFSSYTLTAGLIPTHHFKTMDSSQPSILVVGCGITGASTAYFLRKTFGEEVNIEIWDKARGAGGRMSTNRAPDFPTVPFADMGAQYITKNISGEANEEIYSELLDEGLISPFQGIIAGLREGAETQENYVCPQGFSSIVKYFARGAECVFQRQLLSLRIHSSTEGTDEKKSEGLQRWEAIAQGSEETPSLFDAVVLTIPVPQMLQLQGDISELLQQHHTDLEAVQYSSRWALAVYYPPEAWNALVDVEWSTKYIGDCDVLRYISIEQRKRGQVGANNSYECGPTLLLHTGVPYGIKTMEEDRSQVESLMLQKLENQLQGFSSFQPLRTKMIKWRYSQVYKGFSGSPGAVLLETPSAAHPIILSGDAFSSSGFDSCIAAAQRSCNFIREQCALIEPTSCVELKTSSL